MHRATLLCSLVIDYRSDASFPPYSRIPLWRVWAPSMVCLRDGKICDVRKFLLPWARSLLCVTVQRWCTYFVSAVSRRRLIACLFCRALFNMANVLSKIYARNTWLVSREGVQTIVLLFRASSKVVLNFPLKWANRASASKNVNLPTILIAILFWRELVSWIFLLAGDHVVYSYRHKNNTRFYGNVIFNIDHW